MLGLLPDELRLGVSLQPKRFQSPISQLGQLTRRPGVDAAGRALQLKHRGIAKHVDSVVSQLIALRADLPNWWQGPNADSTLASFDRVITHAHSTQQMAAGAAGLAGMLASLGYEPRDAGPGETQLANCPFHELAVRHRELVCTLNLHLLRAALAELGGPAQARLDPADGRCCVTISSGGREPATADPRPA